jgi:hypothetical protein
MRPIPRRQVGSGTSCGARPIQLAFLGRKMRRLMAPELLPHRDPGIRSTVPFSDLPHVNTSGYRRKTKKPGLDAALPRKVFQPFPDAHFRRICFCSSYFLLFLYIKEDFLYLPENQLRAKAHNPCGESGKWGYAGLDSLGAAENIGDATLCALRRSQVVTRKW